MQTIGERLEEARRRKGISIRDAAEATKIRGDFLSSFENDSFEGVNLPEIYVRGFLKSYARFLKLDADKVMTDYDAVRMGQHKSTRGEKRELGRFSLGGREESEESTTGQMQQRRVIPPQAVEAYDEDGDEESSATLEKTLYLKIALVSGSVFLGILLLVLIINLFSGSDIPDEPVASQTTGAEDRATGQNQTTSTASTQTVVFRATGATAVEVYERMPGSTANNRYLGGRQLAAGDRFEVTRDPRNELIVAFTNGANLIVEAPGIRNNFASAQNVGRARVPATAE